jgi:hypothetical protein
MIGREDENGVFKWDTGISHNGINASLLSVGALDTNKITIRNGSEDRFLWNG